MSARPTALVTGASRGLGFAVAKRLAAHGHHVIALARTIGALEELADEITQAGGDTPTLVPLSISDDSGMQRMCLAIHERWGHLDLAIHCAAHAPPQAPMAHIASGDFEKSTEINFIGTRRAALMLAPLLAAAPAGHFVYVSDPRAGARPFFGAYGATKAGAEAFIRSWMAEQRKLPPKVSLFAPAPMPTALRMRFYPGEATEGLTPCADEAARMLRELELTPASSDR